MEKKKRLGLKLPEQNRAPAGSFLTSAKDVDAWIKSLPMANVGETSHQVFKTLVDFNRIEIPANTRLKIAEQLREPVGYVSKNLRKHYFDSPLPLSAKNRKIAVLNRELYSELAISYKVFIEEMIAATAETFNQKLLIIAIQRAMRYLQRVIYYSVIAYDPVPNGTWQEIHRLYAYSELNKIERLQIRIAEEEDSRTDTIEDLYKQILLFSICSPFRLRQREIQLVFDNLPAWALNTSIALPDTFKQHNCNFMCRLWSDEPPSHVNLQTKQASKRSRVLSTRKLVSELQNQADDMPAERNSADASSEAGHFSKHLLEKLINAYSNAPKREFVRTKLNFELKTAVGLTNIHALISFKPEPEKEPELSAMERHRAVELDWLTSTTRNAALRTEMFNLEEHKLDQGSRNVFFTESEEDMIEGVGIGNCHDGAVPAWASQNNCEEVETFSCKTVNESAGGYCISWGGNNAPKIKIGEVLGIQSATNKNQFGIGISRWLRSNPGQGLQLGMEIISPSSRAISVTSNTNKQNSLETRGLLLPESRAAGHPASLILPTMQFKVNDKLHLKDDNTTEEIKLTQLVESTGAFAQFQFAHLNTRPPLKEHNNSEEDNFDNIWSQI